MVTRLLTRKTPATGQADETGSANNNGQRESKEASVQQAPAAADEPPDGGFGWVVVACVALINGHTWGINSSYGVFLAYYLSNDVFNGASFLEFAFVGGLSISMALMSAPVSTNCTRFFGTRVTLLVGVLFETAALLGASFAHQIWHLFLSQGVCFGIGMGFLFVGSVGLPPQWFKRKRSLANACGAAGSGLGGLVYSLATDAMIKSIGIGWAFRILGIIAFTVNGTCALIVRDRNKAVGSIVRAFDWELAKRSEFLAFLLWGFFSMLGYICLLFSLPNFAQSVGLTHQQGSLISALFNLGQALGRPPIGYFSDTFGRINMAMAMTFLSGLFCLVIWIFAKSFGVLVFYALIGGSVAGTFWATVAPVATEVIGLPKLATALCMTWMCLVLPTTFSEPMALEIATRSPARYLGTQLFAGFMYIAAALFMLFVRYRQVGFKEREAREKDEPGSSDEEQRAHVPSTKPSALHKLVAWTKV